MAVAFDAVGPSSSGATSSASTTLSWNHTVGASGTYLLVGATCDASTDTGLSMTAKYNGVAMTSLGVVHTNNSTAGFLQVWGMANPPTGSALQVLVTVAGGTPLTIDGGSVSFTGAGSLSAIQTAAGNSTSASLAFSPTVTGNMVAAFCGCGSALTPSGSFTSRYNGGVSNAGAGFSAGSTLASTGSSMTASWTIGGTDFFAVIAVEVQVPSGASTGPPFRQAHQPIRAPYPPVARSRGGLIYGSAGKTGSNMTSGSGRVSWSPGAAVANPVKGPVFRQAVRAVQARLPQTPIGAQAFRGRTASNKGAPVRNPTAGPVFQQARQVIRPRVPPPYILGRPGLIYGSAGRTGDVSFGSGRVMWSPGGPVSNPSPVNTGPPFEQAQQPAQAKLPLPRRGTCRAIRFGPLPSNPTSGPPVYPLQGEVRAPVPQNAPRGRVSSNPGVPQQVAPVHAGPPVYPLQGPVRARVPLFRLGRAGSNPGAPVHNPSPGPRAYPPLGPVRARLPQLAPRAGRVTSGPGAPVRNPAAGPPFFPAVQEIRAVIPQAFSKGRAASSPGAPVRNPQHGPFFEQAATPARAVIPQVFSKGRASGNPGAPVANPSRGPVFRQATAPARIRVTLPPRGRTAANPGGPVQNPPPPVLGPVFRQATSPARIRPALPPRGRTASNPGAAVRNPRQGAAFPAAHGPAQARIPQVFSKGRASSSPGGPVQNPSRGPAFRQAVQALRARLPVPFLKGRTAGSPGAPVRNPSQGPAFSPVPRPVRAPVPQSFSKGRAASNPGVPVFIPPVLAGPPFRPRRDPARIRPALPPRGRVSANPGAPVRNPGHGPAFIAKDWPARARIPQNAPRGRTSSNPGGPVANIPVNRILISTGELFVLWETGSLSTLWETGEPLVLWETGSLSALWETGEPLVLRETGDLFTTQ